MAFPRAKVLNPDADHDQLQINNLNDGDANATTSNSTTPSPIKYLPLQRVYSASTQYVDYDERKMRKSSSSAAARDCNAQGEFKVYTRRTGRRKSRCYFEMLTMPQEVEVNVELEKEKEVMSVADGGDVSVRGLKKVKIECGEEAVTLGERLNSTGDLSYGIHLRQCRNSGSGGSGGVSVQKKRKRVDLSEKLFGGQTSVKRWVG